MEMDRPPLGPTSKSLERLFITGLILFGWALIVLLRLFELQVFAHERYVKLAESQQDRSVPLEPRRGSIVDRKGTYLAISSHCWLVAVNPAQIQNTGVAAGLLASILGLDAAKMQADIESAVQSKRHRGYLVVARHVPEEKAHQLAAMKLNWIILGDDSMRSYPNHQLAAHIVGNVNAEGEGAAGIEKKLNKDLAGTPGLMRIKVDVKQRPFESELATAPVSGKTIGLTIDAEVQGVAEDALKAAVIQNHADHGSLVALDSNSGEVLALANYPTYDLNEHLKPGERAQNREDLAVVAPFEPGSVFKIVTLAAALETTNLRPQTVINCGGGVMRLFGRVIHDSHAYAALSLEDVLAKSSNIGAIRIGMQVGSKNLYDYVRRFGFGQRTGIELPAEAPGMVRPLSRWQPTSIGSVPMGHEISVTSLQLAQLGSVIASGGFLVHPRLVAWKQTPGESKEAMKYPAPVQILKPQTVMTMRMMMRRVVMPGGTARRLHVIGYSIAGKTGTAQIFDFAHHLYTHRYNASFLGFAPATNPSVVIVVTVSGTTGEAGFGGAAAGPAFQTVMGTALRRLGIPRDVPEEIEELAEKEKKSSPAKDIDDVAIAELNPPTEEEMKAGSDDAVANGTGTSAEIDPNAPKVPNFVGKTVKDVMQEAASSGIDLDMSGDGLARAQNPHAGALLVPGEHIAVRFAR
jgi:cell division protein FtsI (penicillin-binding protein 3)